jgi:hypothetical protein
MYRLAGLLISLLAVLPAFARAAEPIPPAEFDHLRAVIRPKEEEAAWAKIPWRVDLSQARREAAAAGKPILLWEMDGHPLGCT